MRKPRDPKIQAERAIAPILRLRTAKAGSSGMTIRSLGTMRSYKESLRLAAIWMNKKYSRPLKIITRDQAKQYLENRSTEVGQKTLDRDRRALEMHIAHVSKDPGFKLDTIGSRLTTKKSIRTYSNDRVRIMVNSASPRLALSIKIARIAGLRAHELLTIRPIEERSVTAKRSWNAGIYSGKESWKRYSVAGKGGLIREIRLPVSLVADLEKVRLESQKIVNDRGIKYKSHYDLLGGNSFSTMFTTHSKKLFDYSHGAHGLRHSYATQRMDQLIYYGHTQNEAKIILSQELGHFRKDVVEVYLA